jgi:hypothetical protein
MAILLFWTYLISNKNASNEVGVSGGTIGAKAVFWKFLA